MFLRPHLATILKLWNDTLEQTPFLTQFFQKLLGANIETNTQDARKSLESLDLEDDEQIVSLDVKSLYTNDPVGEAIEIALRDLDSSNLAPDIPRSAMKSLLKLAVTNVHSECNGIWYVQSDGLAMGSSLAVILTLLWLYHRNQKYTCIEPFFHQSCSSHWSAGNLENLNTRSWNPSTRKQWDGSAGVLTTRTLF